MSYKRLSLPAIRLPTSRNHFASESSSDEAEDRQLLTAQEAPPDERDTLLFAICLLGSWTMASSKHLCVVQANARASQQNAWNWSDRSMDSRRVHLAFPCIRALG